MFGRKGPASDLRSVNLRLRRWLCFCLLGNFCLRCFRRFWLWLLRLLVRLQQFLRDVSIWEVLLNPQCPQVSNHPKFPPGQDTSETDNNQCKAHKLQTSWEKLGSKNGGIWWFLPSLKALNPGLAASRCLAAPCRRITPGIALQSCWLQP